MVDREYTVNEEELKIFLKNNPDLKEELRKVIYVDRQVNANKLIQAMEKGIIKYKEIKPCCHEKVSEYLRTSALEE